ncbi:MAG: FKBP-type peptidyl-prolyl cis-trans isomerase, partial [Ketobacteraceae bacterium]|nr:FKBP-type peptidyl-prolyl cis-trans isomerase [Ketobacteraceae bacterium]
ADGANKVVSEAKAGDTAGVEFTSEDQKASYAIGLKYGEAMSRDVKELDLDLFYKGLVHGFKGEKPLLDPQEVMTTLKALQSRKMQEMQQAQQEVASENKEKSEAFLEENKAREGVKTTESGLQYEVISSGEEGAVSPDANDKVKVHYHGTLVDGTVFDSSVDRGEPIEFAVGGVIKGWTEALQLMKKGDKWKLYIPSDLAYGERGAGPKIGPNSALIFEVELLDVIEQE